MKSFNQHITKDGEKLKDKKLKEDLNKKKDEKLEEDLTDILWAAAAGAGLYGIGKAWDKWGTQVVASLPFASDSAKAAAIDKNKELTKKGALFDMGMIFGICYLFDIVFNLFRSVRFFRIVV